MWKKKKKKVSILKKKHNLAWNCFLTQHLEERTFLLKGEMCRFCKLEDFGATQENTLMKIIRLFFSHVGYAG